MVQPPPDLTRYDDNDDTDSVGTSLAHQDMSPPDSPSSLRAASPPHAPPQRLHKPLTRVQRERTREAWASPELAAGRSNNISPRAFHSLRDGTWLQDEAIHRFLRLLVARDAFQASLIDAHRPSFVFTSFFMTQLLNMGDLDPTVQGSYSYSNIQRWSRRVPGQDVFALDKLFLPVNVNRSHWMVIVAFMQEQRIQAYDSAGATNTRFLQATLRYLADEHQRVHNRALPVQDWSLCESTPATPTQLNGYDCGVFTCAFIDCLLRNDTPTFSQEDMTQYRRWITLSLLENQLPIG
ncbi:Sentrin-specific protease 2 [Seminavis robusta]|uniref:Sentrin-specific protease 2 n=1 Tax=Seminavis robusta TaxID=568900 RepID=A0A9N8EW47_9STRA|nr:Sentrin-specific protease 2 [Seminavis robusta]|eukprot:Sro2088_g313920.1 Sentrin-specific protease 2 (294) ;mRNA; f:12109-12990